MTLPILVFAGPSLPVGQRPNPPDFEWRPPAAAGDLLALHGTAPRRLCLIDGVFDAQPAVWHKEILLLLAAGWQILGASSMGALRAAELDRLGMIGVGMIYRAYADGRLTGDDEVALLHGPEEFGWQPLTEPLVDVRATLLAARRKRSIGSSQARALLSAAQALHYADRIWPQILANASEPADSAVAANPVRLKTIDALACLDLALRMGGAAKPYPPPPITCFISALADEIGVSLTVPSRSWTSAMNGALSGGAKAR